MLPRYRTRILLELWQCQSKAQIKVGDANDFCYQHTVVRVFARGVQYVHWVMHKCIMVKVGGKYT